jgi:hypothetical protein
VKRHGLVKLQEWREKELKMEKNHAKLLKSVLDPGFPLALDGCFDYIVTDIFHGENQENRLWINKRQACYDGFAIGRDELLHSLDDPTLGVAGWGGWSYKRRNSHKPSPSSSATMSLMTRYFDISEWTRYFDASEYVLADSTHDEDTGSIFLGLQ